MSDLEKLLATVEALDPDKRTEGEDAPADGELSEARKGLEAALQAAVEGDEPDLAAANTIEAAINSIDSELVSRNEKREADRAEAKAILERVKGPQAAEGEQEEGGDGEQGEGEGSEEELAPQADKKDEVSLAAAISRSTARTEARVKATPVNPDVMVAAVGLAQGMGLDQNATIDDVAQVFNRYAPQVKRGGQVFVHLDMLYPEDRALGLSSEENTRIIEAITSPRAITAAGGTCEPLPADFAHPICGDRGRPITNSLPGFRADRGGVRFSPSITVDDLESAITVWTAENDASDSPSPATKACPRVECDEESSATVDAIVACLTVGNFQARFNPEFWRSRLDLLMVAHDRVAEQTAYATMVAAADTTLVPAGAGDGTITDVLRVVDMQTAGIRSRNRLLGTRFFTILPSWVQNALRTQLANQAPAGSADLFEVADARINNFFAARGVTPIYSPDIELIGAQTPGAALAAYNTPFNVLTYPEGTFLFLNGGTLDLGTQIADSTLNATNDRQAFMETFEQVVMRGCEALVTPVAVAADCICA